MFCSKSFFKVLYLSPHQAECVKKFVNTANEKIIYIILWQLSPQWGELKASGVIIVR